jgi:hypothetical protein
MAGRNLHAGAREVRRKGRRQSVVPTRILNNDSISNAHHMVQVRNPVVEHTYVSGRWTQTINMAGWCATMKSEDEVSH